MFFQYVAELSWRPARTRSRSTDRRHAPAIRNGWSGRDISVALAGAVLAAGLAAQEPTAAPSTEDKVIEQPDDTKAPVSKPWSAFHVDDLCAQREEAAVSYLEFFDDDAFSAGLYHLAAGATDGQQPHALDEIYYVAHGRSAATIDGVEYDVKPGDILWVAAGADHRFHTITEDLDLVVVFPKRPPIKKTTAGRLVTNAEQTRGRNPARNTWDPFLDEPSMMLGMYMLPRTQGGDDALVHPWNELNVVVNGNARFTMGEDTIDLTPGSIVFVPRDIHHKFHDLTKNFDVLIGWERPPEKTR